MERGNGSWLGTMVKGITIVGGLLIAAKMYLTLLPHSPALGAMLVIGAGAFLAFFILHLDRRVEEIQAEARATEYPPGW